MARIDTQAPDRSAIVPHSAFQRGVGLDCRPQRASDLCPSVSTSLRIVQFNKRISRRLSNYRIEWLGAERYRAARRPTKS
jgi:hypothetical protein